MSLRRAEGRSGAIAAACAMAMALGLAAHSQQPAEPGDPTLQERPPEGPVLHVTAREVLLDVVVTDKAGRPITGLKPADFHVTEEGTPQKIAHLEEHLPATPEEAARSLPPKLPPNTFTNYAPVPATNAYTVILLDALDTHMDDQMMVRHELIQYLKSMTPGTPVAIFQMDLRMRLIQGFTTDPKVLLEAAESKRDMPSMLKPMRGGRDEYIMATSESLQDGFRVMGRYLAAFPGRKNLVWLTGAVPGTNWQGSMGSPDFSMGNPFTDDFSVLGQDPNNLTDALTLSRVAVYPIDARGLQAPPMFSAQRRSAPSSQSMMNWQAGLASEHMFMSSVAESTGGRAFYNSNGLKDTLRKIIDNGSDYYTIAYSTTNTKWEGEFRHIKLVLDRPDVTAQYRPGYYAIDRTQQEQRQLAALERKGWRANAAQASASTPSNGVGAVVRAQRAGFDVAMQMGAVPPTEIVFAARLTESKAVEKLDKKEPLPKDNYLREGFRDKPFRKFSIGIQLNAGNVRFTRKADGLRYANLQIVTVVYTQTGEQVNSLQTSEDLRVSDDEYRKLMKTGIPAIQEIAVPVKGNYFLRIGVHDKDSDRVGALEIAADQVQPEAPGPQAKVN